jgi:hypothetical protein
MWKFCKIVACSNFFLFIDFSQFLFLYRVTTPKSLISFENNVVSPAGIRKLFNFKRIF